LTAHRTLASVPRPELEWLAAHVSLERHDAGDLIRAKGEQVLEMFVIFSGRLGVRIERGSGHRHLFEFAGGDVGGALPYSRLGGSPGDAYYVEPSEVLVVHRDLFPAMIRECPVLTATTVHVMLDRARQFVASDWQDEKMVSLGRLAAGMAHELNNPASATARSARHLGDTLRELEHASMTLGAAGLTPEQLERVTTLRDRCLIPVTTGVFSAIERSDLEQEIAGWLESHGADTLPAAALAENGVMIETLDELAEVLTGTKLDVALSWIAVTHTARSLSAEIERAGGRIYDLVSAVKRFTYMDRATVTEPTNIAHGLGDTVAVLAGKARAKGAAVRLDVPTDLPLVAAYAGELNQVWANLLDNAIDAVPPSGKVAVTARVEGQHVVVRFVDDGPGIPPELRSRIFDPFFTTKPVGEGSGLGLDIAQRIIRLHRGEVAVDSLPGRTEFRISLPIAT
jgi:signal transduction histidine kinase